MEVPVVAAAKAHVKSSWRARVVGVLFGLLLLGFGGALVFLGATAISNEAFDLQWKATRMFSFGVAGVSQSSSGVTSYRGAAAIRMGIGLASAGAMLSLWGAGMAVAAFRRLELKKADRPGRFGRVLACLSLGALFVAMFCFFPVWQINSLIFWTEVIAVPLIVIRLYRLCRPRWIPRLFFGLILAVVLTDLVGLGPGCPVAIILGIFAMIFALGHVVYLFPDFADKHLVDSNGRNAA